MVRHIVSWNFKPELTEEERRTVGAEVVSKLNALQDKIPCLTEIKAFCPPLDSSSCDLALYSAVEKAADLPVYQNHPEHQAVVTLIKANFTDRRCVDIDG